MSTMGIAESKYAEKLSKLGFYAVWEKLPLVSGVVDPFNFEQRLAIYKTLIEGMNKTGVFGAESEWNIFWGYVFQVDWQWHSGRLALADTPEGRIDPNSMWGYSNYSLSVLPYLAAAQMGIVPEIELAAPFRDSMLEYPSGKGAKVPAIFDEAMRAWVAFFKAALAFEPGKDIEPLRLLQWIAHGQSLIAAEPGIRALGERYYSKDELYFLLGWVRYVDFLQAALWRTDLIYMLEFGVGVLPPRLITDKDVPGQVADMDANVNKYLKNIIDFANQSPRRFAFNLFLWKRAMRTREARNDVAHLLDATLNPTPQNAPERRRMLKYMLAQ